MVPGKYYFAFDLAREHDFSVSTIHVKLCELADEGYVEYRKSGTSYKDPKTGGTINRLQYRRTGKNIPIRGPMQLQS